MGNPDADALHDRLLAWFQQRKRDLPFRRTRDPYAILVAEVLLQRTRIAAGLPYYERFIRAFPTVRDLAQAPESDVLKVWEGLGFYGRARNLHRAAKAIVKDFDGSVPSDFDALRTLPGIGDYTAGAVASIAFGLRFPAIDGNASRVLSRVYRIEGDVDRGAGRARIRAIATDLVPEQSPGTWNQAMMELGAIVCVPRAPRCPSCPISGECLAFGAGVQDSLPTPHAKRRIPIVPVVFAVVRDGTAVLLVRRERGLHAGMYGLPGGERSAKESESAAIRRHLRNHGIKATNLRGIGIVRHGFSHRRWEGNAFSGTGRGTPRGAEWIPIARLRDLPMVPVHRQLLERVASSST